MELAEMGIVIKDYLLAIVMSKSLPLSYDKCVATIFAGIKDLEQADSRYVANKIFEEEMRREYKSEDANIAFPRKYCSNCKKPGHLMEDCYGIVL
ncbi:Bgt-51360 [Blumeria graminis f. sp. tritici]|uniref:Bgt-51360 n=1 Tax=Blumeria graminis f. sp. tritici TaxID=62690 RepID=A0A9X9QD78_BLUGR|nr:Bgt-51360 [Blumeria graminis f. sp. tritici]